MILISLKNIRKFPFTVLLSMCLQCVDCIRVAGVGIGPHIVTCCIYLIISIKSRITLVRKNIFLVFGLTLFGIIIISLNINNLMQLPMLFKSFQFLVYLLVANLLIKNISMTKQEIKKVIDSLVIFLLVMGIIQVLMTINVLPDFWLFKQLFYNNTDNVAFYNENYFRICSTFMEPSYYAPFLCALFFYYHKENGKKERILSYAILGEIILTFSTTAYVTFIGAYIIYLVMNMWNTKTIIMKDIVFIGCGVLGIGVLLVGTDVLDNVIFNKMSTTSAIVRNQWNDRALDSFYKSPVFGMGYKQSRASSIINCLLGELGVTGLISYILMFCGLFNRIKRESRSIVCVLMVLCVLISQIVAIPDIDLSSAWLVIFTACILNFSQYRDQKVGGDI